MTLHIALSVYPYGKDEITKSFTMHVGQPQPGITHVTHIDNLEILENLLRLADQHNALGKLDFGNQGPLSLDLLLAMIKLRMTLEKTLTKELRNVIDALIRSLVFFVRIDFKLPQGARFYGNSRFELFFDTDSTPFFDGAVRTVKEVAL